MFKLFDVVEPKIKSIKLDKSKRIKVGNYTQTKKLVKEGNVIKLVSRSENERSRR